MILLGAAGLLARIGKPERAAYAMPFIEHVLAHHLDARSGLLVDVPGRDSANVGHALEFVGFILEYLGKATPRALLGRLESILVTGFEAGFVGPGVSLAIAPGTGAPLSPLCPWWSLPEAIRAAALCHAVSGSEAALGVWQRAHDAFFTHYWRGTPPIAYQTMNASGPVDYVPATPDLDPGYHTGLSLLAAIEVVPEPRRR
jgi:mannose/cellobiose epimerase-like protein (N-acyl-D-glucosamine 2-epimerase family)